MKVTPRRKGKLQPARFKRTIGEGSKEKKKDELSILLDKPNPTLDVGKRQLVVDETLVIPPIQIIHPPPIEPNPLSILVAQPITPPSKSINLLAHLQEVPITTKAKEVFELEPPSFTESLELQTSFPMEGRKSDILDHFETELLFLEGEKEILMTLRILLILMRILRIRNSWSMRRKPQVWQSPLNHPREGESRRRMKKYLLLRLARTLCSVLAPSFLLMVKLMFLCLLFYLQWRTAITCT